jgi:rhamnosyltransferase
VAALTAIGGFDESLGIDAVDAAACLRLRERGFIVALAPGVRLEHRVGSARQVTLLGRTVLATGHSPQRRTTMVRNRLRLAPAEFRQSPKHAVRTLRRVGVNAVLGATVEENRWAKTKGTIRGLWPRASR